MKEIDLFSMRRDYSGGSLNEKTICADPILQFNIWFTEATESGEFEPNAMCLATGDKEGNISARMVLLKNISSGNFIFFTNYESTKGRQLLANPNAALLFFWPELMRQVRIEGSVTKISEEDSLDYFDSRPAESKASAILSKQSDILPDKTAFDKEVENLVNSDSVLEKPANWGGYALKPHTFEFWQGGKGRSHDRFKYSLNPQGWDIKRLYP